MRHFLDIIGLSNRAWNEFIEIEINDELQSIKITNVKLKYNYRKL